MSKNGKRYDEQFKKDIVRLIQIVYESSRKRAAPAFRLRRCAKH
ncbi:hypothetical protein DHBDCA_p1666 [Dehalobacter sp. DCA]|nr:hypothetical protein DHBDCA_p1666 [Dehalobacter sp. DCA]AFV05677.1 hypothetical protein DCF50_p1675 [Dehalobacter sp. CF]